MFPPESNILIVDDSAAALHLVRQQLTALGFRNILEAENGKVALKKLDDLNKVGIDIQLIIADWSMPEMNGIDLLLTLKDNAKYNNIPFLMITSESGTENVIKAIALGVSDFVIKPLDETIIASKLTGIWNRIQKRKTS